MDFAKRIQEKVSSGSKIEEKLLKQLLTSISAYLSTSEQSLVLKAYEYGARAHKEQRRKSGEPYICHPLSVAQILAEMRMDGETICAALLHDVIEDTEILSLIHI